MNKIKKKSDWTLRPKEICVNLGLGKPKKELILDKIRKILDDENMKDEIKILNIYSLIREKYEYYTKPWYIK